MSRNKLLVWYAALAPGILVAATGVGAGDLLTASMAGSKIGLALLWAAPLGAVLKWAINEGIARWQLATDTTLLEGWSERLGRWIQWVFLGYLLIWSVFTGGALVNACGVAGTGLWQLGDEQTSKVVWGILHSLLGLALVRLGGFALFEVMMGLCIAVMFGCVVLTAILIPGTDWAEVARGLNPAGKLPANSLPWVLGVLGGVGGTVTVLSYGYWIREKGRQGESGLSACRLDLAVGYCLTALFGMAMIIIGSHVVLDGKGPRLALVLADQLALALGPFGYWVFLVGFWGAVFSSLLGVWQSVPYLFADFLALYRGMPRQQRRALDLDRTKAYWFYLLALAIVPLPLLWFKLENVQLAYAILGALFMPLLALTLLIMNNRIDWVGKKFRTGRLANALLIITVGYFAYQGGMKVYELLTG